MLSSLEMISEPSGKTKTLADLIKEGSIITPETPVHTSDDSVELKDYIESLLPEPTSASWSSYTTESFKIVTGSNIALPNAINAALDDVAAVYTDVIITINDSTAKSAYTIMDTWAHFKSMMQTADQFYSVFMMLGSTSTSGYPIKIWTVGKTEGVYYIKCTAASQLGQEDLTVTISIR